MLIRSQRLSDALEIHFVEINQLSCRVKKSKMVYRTLKGLYSLMDKLLKFSNSHLRIFYYREYNEESIKGSQIFIIERRSKFYGEKVRDDL